MATATDKPFMQIWDSLVGVNEFTPIRTDSPIDEAEQKQNTMILIFAMLIGAGLLTFTLFQITRKT